MHIKTAVLLMFLNLCLIIKGQTYEESPSDFFFSDNAEDNSLMMAPSLISTGMNEIHATMASGGDEFYYCVKGPGRFSVIVGLRFEDGFWSHPEVVSFSGGENTDLSPFVSPDGRFLYFVSDRPRSATDEIRNFNIWRCRRQDDGSWGNPELTEFSKYSGNEISVSVDRVGNVYFCADYESNSLSFERDALDIYWVRKKTGNTWGEVQKLGSAVNTEKIEQTPAISPDGKTLVFSSLRGDGLGAADLYVSFLREDGWSGAVNLGRMVNTTAYEWCPAFSGDGQWLLFSGNLMKDKPDLVTYTSVKRWLLGDGNGASDIWYIRASAIQKLKDNQ
ncbi:PD40 domain-containing protein [Anaerophaga thermohalophila]|uniref:PD40 domain-containing protein n=1 Tax=Anaerophaga thermohalophila TaxID=177400 RepID=UPI00030E1299|nr:PD40 domain-containing protein [Anaerophaga thermohalophila]